ncbi:MAG TPA: cytochrome C, partial [Desulfobacteraceae bacterium]|nr:cytochrome C [Desulfobacteraceae bacterium]
MKDSKSFLKTTQPVWKKLIKPAILVSIGIVIAFPIFSMSYFTMVR